MGNPSNSRPLDTVDDASFQSFPASDPPPWTLGSGESEGHMDRIEHDTMGEVPVPLSAFYGAQTRRAVLNFPVGDNRLQPEFIRALGLIKACAARVNEELGTLSSDLARAIAEAADQIADGKYFDQFVVSVF